MVIVTTTWGEADHEAEHAELNLLRAEMQGTLQDLAQVESVAIDRRSGFVAVKVRLPEDLTKTERANRRDWVQARLSRVVQDAFADEEIVLAPVLVVAV